jgi:hypothetical protein
MNIYIKNPLVPPKSTSLTLSTIPFHLITFTMARPLTRGQKRSLERNNSVEDDDSIGEWAKRKRISEHCKNGIE